MLITLFVLLFSLPSKNASDFFSFPLQSSFFLSKNIHIKFQGKRIKQDKPHQIKPRHSSESIAITSLPTAFTTLAKQLYSVNFQRSRNNSKDCSAGRILPADIGGSETWISHRTPFLKIFFFTICVKTILYPYKLVNYYLTIRA